MIRSKLVKNINSNTGMITVSIKDIIDELLCGNTITNIQLKGNDSNNEVTKYNESCKLYSKKQSIKVIPTDNIESLTERASRWNIPPKYKNIDVIDYLISKCKNDNEVKRVSDELIEYHNRNQLIILNVMIYLVDIMRENNIVWGIGRGSSVASFCLFLIGINKINPMEYDIPYTEFFK